MSKDRGSGGKHGDKGPHATSPLTLASVPLALMASESHHRVQGGRPPWLGPSLFLHLLVGFSYWGLPCLSSPPGNPIRSQIGGERLAVRVVEGTFPEAWQAGMPHSGSAAGRQERAGAEAAGESAFASSAHSWAPRTSSR